MNAYFNILEHHKVLDAIDVIYYSSVIHPTRIAPRFHDFVYVIDGSFDFYIDGNSVRSFRATFSCSLQIPNTEAIPSARG